jgi:hypothetical protein
MPGSCTEGQINRDSFLTEELDEGEESAMANRAAHSNFNINPLNAELNPICHLLA